MRDSREALIVPCKASEYRLTLAMALMFLLLSTLDRPSDWMPPAFFVLGLVALGQCIVMYRTPVLSVDGSQLAYRGSFLRTRGPIDLSELVGWSLLKYRNLLRLELTGGATTEVPLHNLTSEYEVRLIAALEQYAEGCVES